MAGTSAAGGRRSSSMASGARHCAAPFLRIFGPISAARRSGRSRHDRPQPGSLFPLADGWHSAQNAHMRILLVQPPEGSAFGVSKVFLPEPLGLELVAAALTPDGHELKLIDLRLEPWRQLARTLHE